MLAYLCKAQISDTTAQNLVTFFSVVFGFYTTSVAILYSASYTKKLHEYIDEKQQKWGTQILKSYLLTSGYCSSFSILLIITFMTFATKTNGVLSVHLASFLLPI